MMAGRDAMMAAGQTPSGREDIYVEDRVSECVAGDRVLAMMASQPVVAEYIYHYESYSVFFVCPISIYLHSLLLFK